MTHEHSLPDKPSGTGFQNGKAVDIYHCKECGERVDVELDGDSKWVHPDRQVAE